MAHITGGGLDNISRIIPPGLRAELQPWKIPPMFLEVKERARLSWDSLLRTFNCGLGLVLIIKDSGELLKSGAVRRRGMLRLGRVASESGALGRKACRPPHSAGGRWILDKSALQKKNQKARRRGAEGGRRKAAKKA